MGNAVEKMVVFKGRTEAIGTAVLCTLLAIGLFILAGLRVKRDQERRAAGNGPVTLEPSPIDRYPAWVYVVAALPLLVIPWLWVYATFRWRSAALLDGAG